MANSVSSAGQLLTSASGQWINATTGSNQWYQTLGTGTGTASIPSYTNVTTTYPSVQIEPEFYKDVFMALRRSPVTSFCCDCKEVVMMKPHELTCRYCDRQYAGEIAIHEAKISHESMAVTTLEGKCPACGCHNMTRLDAYGLCPKCGEDHCQYLPVQRQNNYMTGYVEFTSGTNYYQTAPCITGTTIYTGSLTGCTTTTTP
jgi:DNA-directed RNA polymerase subunit M/transcription elongation factor TFIIS